jgi:hypothetical protein
MAKKEKYPIKTPDKEEKKITEKEKDECSYGMAKIDAITCPPARHYDFLLEGVGDIFSHMPFSKENFINQ